MNINRKMKKNEYHGLVLNPHKNKYPTNNNKTQIYSFFLTCDFPP